MKRSFLAFVLIIMSAISYADPAVKYCELLVYRPGFKSGVYVAEMHVDGMATTKSTILRDNAGHRMKFASGTDAVNYVAKQGWELVTVNRSHNGDIVYTLKKSI
jgi:hypothetical protein